MPPNRAYLLINNACPAHFDVIFIAGLNITNGMPTNKSFSNLVL